jgi:thiamine pyrophosphate-dependent acetolactate synthase large subunit-like protein
VPAVGVDTAAALEHELRKALAANGPTIIEALVDGTHYSQTVFD